MKKTKKEENYTYEEDASNDEVKEDDVISVQVEDKKSPEKWAKEYKIDPMLVLWWTKQEKNITKKEFEEILKKLQIKTE
ncbi:MAG: hypothetical protein PHW93_06410 [Candidatus Methanomethylophilaceae archaeon]|nr:hypothetical protein [Candidatus Methanomethylophilaceae archaeon]